VSWSPDVLCSWTPPVVDVRDRMVPVEITQISMLAFHALL